MSVNEQWTPGEIVRALTGFDQFLRRIEDKLDNKPSKDDLGNLKLDQVRKDTEQDKAIEAVEKRLESDIRDHGSRLDKLLFGMIGTALTSLAAIVVAIATR